MMKSRLLASVAVALMVAGASQAAVKTASPGASDHGMVTGLVAMPTGAAEAPAWDAAPPGRVDGARDLSTPAGPADLDLSDAAKSPYLAGAGVFNGAAAPAPIVPDVPTGTRPPAATGIAAVWDVFRGKDGGGLPEPASWALMLIGFGMIGGALRGFVLANRRLAKLQPEETE
jgi:hypothetical protein